MVSDWVWVDVFPQVNILVEVDNEFLVFEQTKYGLRGSGLAVVGGFMEEGETPRAAAVRELNEGMGLEIGHLVDLGTFRVDVNRGEGEVTSFLAVNCHIAATKLASDDLETQAVVRLSQVPRCF